MKRILFISQYLNRAGTEAFMMSVARCLPTYEMVADFLLFCEGETDYSREVGQLGGKVYRIRSRRQSPLGWYADNLRFFRLHHSEYVAIHYCGGSLTAIAPLVAAWLYGVRVRIVHAHNSSAAGWHNTLLHHLKRGLAYYMATDHLACSSLAAEWFFGNRDAQLIKNGIDTQRFCYQPAVRDRKRKELGVREEERLIGHVGRFVPEKNHEMIVSVFAECAKQEPNAKLLLIGTGPLEEQVQKQIAALGFTDKVILAGERCDVNELLQAMDIFLMPSTFEGLPFVLIEAQCSGLPCVISNVINRDISLTDSVYFESLDADTSKWAEIVVKALSEKRRDGSEVIRQAGYDQQESVKKMIAFYTR